MLNRDLRYEKCTGNNCTLEIKKDFTKVVDNFSEFDEECLIETKELKNILNYAQVVNR